MKKAAHIVPIHNRRGFVKAKFIYRTSQKADMAKFAESVLSEVRRGTDASRRLATVEVRATYLRPGSAPCSCLKVTPLGPHASETPLLAC
jgi:hypothetical protein